MKRKRVYIVLLSALLLVSLILPGIAFANSAQTYWSGVSGTGAIIIDDESPIEVQKELLTFDIQQFPEEYYSTPDAYLTYTGTVTAEYTFYNPSNYSVTARLLFPFGNIPDYGMLYDQNTYAPMYRTDSGKYGVAVNGVTIDAVLRHSFAYPYEAFDLENGLVRLSDGYMEDPFYSPELIVTKYCYHAENVDYETYDAATVAIQLPFGEGKTKYVMVENNGFELLEDGFRLSSFIRHWEVDNIITFYVIGEQPDRLLEWKFYENGACEKEIQGTMILDHVESITFQDVALSQYPADSECSPSDWYNAVVISMKINEVADGFVGNDFSYGEEIFNVNRCLMRWFAYEITLGPGEIITNSVIAPMYPDIDAHYEPPVYSYEYLLSPAKTWADFGSLDIIINTPFFMTDSNLKGFEKIESGYALSLDGLPEGELLFTLSTVEEPSNSPQIRMTGAWIMFLLRLFMLIAIPILGIILVVIELWKRIKK